MKDLTILLLSQETYCALGDVTTSDSYNETSGSFFCQGQDTLILNGSGLVYEVMGDEFNNCNNLVDDTLLVGSNSAISKLLVQEKEPMHSLAMDILI